MIGLHLPEGPLRVLAVGAHCDDVEIGAGGLLRRIVHERPDVTVAADVLASTQERAAETAAALAALVAPVAPRVRTHGLRDGRLPAQFDEVKDALGAAAAEPWDLVLAPHPDDAHQDHALVGGLVPTAFRDHLVLHYEIPKWDGDLGRLVPNVYLPLTAEDVESKWRLLDEHYPSQRGHDWWQRETFSGLARLRGMECRTDFAEAFRMTKGVLRLTTTRETP